MLSSYGRAGRAALGSRLVNPGLKMLEFNSAFSTILEGKPVKHLVSVGSFFVSRELTMAQRSPWHYSMSYENAGDAGRSINADERAQALLHGST